MVSAPLSELVCGHCRVCWHHDLVVHSGCCLVTLAHAQRQKVVARNMKNTKLRRLDLHSIVFGVTIGAAVTVAIVIVMMIYGLPT